MIVELLKIAAACYLGALGLFSAAITASVAADSIARRRARALDRFVKVETEQLDAELAELLDGEQ